MRHYRQSITFCLFGLAMLPAQAADKGIFTRAGDVGVVKHAGSVSFDAGTGSYTVSGGGENMWSSPMLFISSGSRCQAT